MVKNKSFFQLTVNSLFEIVDIKSGVAMIRNRAKHIYLASRSRFILVSSSTDGEAY